MKHNEFHYEHVGLEVSVDSVYGHVCDQLKT